jgi:hypothetical protein
MWTLKNEYKGKNKQQLASELKSRLLVLKTVILQIKNIEVGINAINHTKNHDIVLITEFNNTEDLAVYSKHPEHLKVVEFVKNIATDRAAVDYL